MAATILDAPLSISLDDLQTGIQNEEDAGFKLVDLSKGTLAGVSVNLASFEPLTAPLEDIQLVATPPGLFVPTGTGSFDVDPTLSTAFVQEMACDGLAVERYCPIVSINGNDTSLAVLRHVGSILVPGNNPLQPIPGATPVGAPKAVASRIDTSADRRPTFAGVASATSGLTGEEITFSDGTVVTRGNETLTARIDPLGSRGPLQAKILKVKKGNIITVQHTNYSYRSRELPVCHLEENFQGFPPGTPIIPARATTFGKFDPTDGGVGSPALKLVQTCSSLFGASVKKSRLIATFGNNFANSPKLLNAMVEIFHPKTARFARVPLVDIGPSPGELAELDLTAVLDDFLGTKGSGQVQFRIVVV